MSIKSQAKRNTKSKKKHKANGKSWRINGTISPEEFKRIEKERAKP